MFKKLLLCDGPNSNQVGYDIVVYWSSFQEGDGAYSVPRVIESKSSFLKFKTPLNNFSAIFQPFYKFINIIDNF